MTASFDLRIGNGCVRFAAPAGLLPDVVGPLASLGAVGAHGVRPRPSGDPTIEVVADRDPSIPEAPLGDVRWDRDAKAVVAGGLGRAEVPSTGPIRVRVGGPVPPGDALSEGLVIPALAERLRRVGTHLAHAAVVTPPGSPRSAWLIPASRGGGKTTLALSLRRRGFTLLSDDRCFLIGASPGAALVDPWPEAPRVGDRSSFLLPPHVALSGRDDRTGKSRAWASTPPRIGEPLAVTDVLVPRLVPGPGGAVRPLRGAEALARVAREVVVATDPDTAAASLAFVATLLSRVRVREVEVGNDPARLEVLP